MARESDQYRQRDEDTGQYYWTCPTCDGERFDSLQGWKIHMQSKHGGYTVGDVQAAAAEAEEQAATTAPKQPVTPVVQAGKPKRLSAKARELNDKFNRCITLCIKHMLKGLGEGELAELEQLRGDVSEAVIGVEFDFEEKLVSINGKWAMVIALGLLYVLPQIPTLKDVIAKAKAKAAEAKKKAEAK